MALEVTHVVTLGFNSFRERPVLRIFEGQPFPVLEFRLVQFDQFFDFGIGQSQPQTCGSMMRGSLLTVIDNGNGDHDLLSQLHVEIVEG
jgi:hypothetical protein